MRRRLLHSDDDLHVPLALVGVALGIVAGTRAALLLPRRGTGHRQRRDGPVVVLAWHGVDRAALRHEELHVHHISVDGVDVEVDEQQVGLVGRIVVLGVEDDVLPDLDVVVLEQFLQPRADLGPNRHEQAAAPLNVLLQNLDLMLEERLLRRQDHQEVAVDGHGLVVRQRQAAEFDALVQLHEIGQRAHAPDVGRDDLAMAFRFVDEPLVGAAELADRLDQDGLALVDRQLPRLGVAHEEVHDVDLLLVHAAAVQRREDE